MALFHFHVDQIGRSAGRSAVACAAYRSGEKLYSEYYGETSDYTRKGGVMYSEIMLPPHAPMAYADRQTLWNAVEKAERRHDAQLAYSFDIALQNELTFEENLEVARAFLLQYFVGDGMTVDFCVHDPERDGIVICSAGICDEAAPSVVLPKQICNSKKVSDHHAIIPTLVAGETDIGTLPIGEREIIRLIAKQVLRSVSESYRFRETVAVLSCGDNSFTAKGKIVQNVGWKAYSEKEQTDKTLPELADGDELKVASSEIKEGTTKPPSHFTEDSLLSAMETAGAKEMPDDAERKGLGTPATRAGIIEKLIATGFVERRKAKKSVNLIPANTGISLITVLPEQLQSPLLTAEWEHKLKMVEHGELGVDAFIAEISLMVNELVKTYSVIKGAEVLFPSGRDVVGKCPRCGGNVTESKKGFFCETNDCRFGLWRDNKFLTGKKITMSKKMAAALLKNGEIPVKGIFSEKTGKSYDATLVLNDDGAKSVYSLDFGKK